jgi:hypothetical protein
MIANLRQSPHHDDVFTNGATADGSCRDKDRAVHCWRRCPLIIKKLRAGGRRVTGRRSRAAKAFSGEASLGRSGGDAVRQRASVDCQSVRPGSIPASCPFGGRSLSGTATASARDVRRLFGGGRPSRLFSLCHVAAQATTSAGWPHWRIRSRGYGRRRVSSRLQTDPLKAQEARLDSTAGSSGTILSALANWRASQPPS